MPIPGVQPVIGTYTGKTHYPRHCKTKITTQTIPLNWEGWHEIEERSVQGDYRLDLLTNNQPRRHASRDLAACGAYFLDARTKVL